MRPLLALLACLTVVAAAANAPALAAYAIAFNTSNGRAAAYNGSFDLETAKRVALDKCGRGCRIVVSGKASCAAVVESISTGHLGLGRRQGHDQGHRREIGLARLPPQGWRQLQNRGSNLRLSGRIFAWPNLCR